MMQPEQHFYFSEIEGPDATLSIVIPKDDSPTHKFVRSVIDQLSSLTPIALKESDTTLEITTMAITIDTFLNILTASRFYQRKIAFSTMHMN